MSNQKIKYVNACSGGLVFTMENDLQRRADDIADGVYFVEKYGLADGLYFASDMDFASEYGFTNDGNAKKMFDQIMNNIDTRVMEEV